MKKRYYLYILAMLIIIATIVVAYLIISSYKDNIENNNTQPYTLEQTTTISR